MVLHSCPEPGDIGCIPSQDWRLKGSKQELEHARKELVRQNHLIEDLLIIDPNIDDRLSGLLSCVLPSQHKKISLHVARMLPTASFFAHPLNLRVCQTILVGSMGQSLESWGWHCAPSPHTKKLWCQVAVFWLGLSCSQLRKLLLGSSKQLHICHAREARRSRNCYKQMWMLPLGAFEPNNLNAWRD